MGGDAETVASYLAEHYTEGASLGDALAVAVASLGHSTEGGQTTDRVIPVTDLEVAVLDRTRTQPRKFARIRPAVVEDLLGDRGPGEHAAPEEGPDGPAAPPPPPPPATEDDPADPTDQVSGDVPPLEDPESGEPPVAPPL